MSKKDNMIAELQEQIDELEDAYQDLSRQYHQKCFELYKPTTPPAKRRRYFGSVAVDLWPLSDWARLSHSRWKPGHYFQVCVGPIRVDFAEE